MLTSLTNDLGLMAYTPDAVAHAVIQRHVACHKQHVKTIRLPVPDKPHRYRPGSEQYRTVWQQCNKDLRDWAKEEAHPTFIDPLGRYIWNPQLWAADGLHLSLAGSVELGRKLANAMHPKATSHVHRCLSDSGMDWSMRKLPCPSDDCKAWQRQCKRARTVAREGNQ